MKYNILNKQITVSPSYNNDPLFSESPAHIATIIVCHNTHNALIVRVTHTH